MSTNANSLADEHAQRNVLFLDYDGVIHRGSSYRTRKGIVSDDPKNIRLFEFAPLLAELLEPYRTLEIVLSTSWVPILGFNRAKMSLPVASLRDRVSGATYHSRYADAWAWPTIGRGIQVLRYVRVHRLSRWLAIDDRSDGFDGYEEHLVQCDEQSALGEFETVKLLQRRLAEQFGKRSAASDA